MSDWYPAPTIVHQRAAENRKWPRRPKASDGIKGDAAHAKRPSDHNPDPSSKPPGIVRAADTTMGAGIHRPTWVASMLLHPSTRYLISVRKIYRRQDGFRPRHYVGTSDPHIGHAHRSIEHSTTAANSTINYTLIENTPDWSTPLRHGATGWQVKILQALLIAWGYSLTLDGVYGPGTGAALRKAQARFGLKTDGVAGTVTLNRMLGR